MGNKMETLKTKNGNEIKIFAKTEDTALKQIMENALGELIDNEALIIKDKKSSTIKNSLQVQKEEKNEKI